MITTQQEKIIDKYVNNKYFDVARLKKYLAMHSTVGNEVFGYCDRHIDDHEKTTYTHYLDDEVGYVPLSVEKFLKRVPFYFYVPEKMTIDTFCALGAIIPIEGYHCKNVTTDDLEECYKNLEFLFYDLKLPLVDIFNYCTRQRGIARHVFPQWCHYLHLCTEQLGWNDYMPNRFTSKYNEALEACGMPPIIYEIHEVGLGEAFWRKGNKLVFEGEFPCDENRNPIMRWIGVRVKNAASITCDCENSKQGDLTVEITPNTIIDVLNFYNEEDSSEDFWYQVYAGPMTMRFDNTALKYYRNQQHLTQQEVADAVGAAVRTYQKWENGTTTPDGHYLLRLMNWLDIRSVQDLIAYD